MNDAAATPPSRPGTMDPTQRFTDRVDDYARYRPGYPDAVATTLIGAAGLRRGARVVDVGSGTGISSELFLRHGLEVVGVEPNAAMRAASDRLRERYPSFHAVDGTAERTGLGTASVDAVVAGQAFHWFEPDTTRREFARVLRPGGVVALIWNTRLVDETPFLREYEALLLEFGTDYTQIDHRRVGPEQIRAFLGCEPSYRTFPNRQELDRDGVRGRLLSSSYVPGPDQPGREAMLRALEALFDRHNRAGRVAFEYRTELFFGPISRGG